MGVCNQILTWITRSLMAYQILLSYWGFEDIRMLYFAGFTQVVTEEHGIYLYIWNTFALAFGVLIFVGIRAICEPGQYFTENNIYFEFLDLATRIACSMCWLYYFIVAFAWILYTEMDASRLSVTLGFLLLVLLANVGEINTTVLTIILATCHLYICILEVNYWGIALSLSMIQNGIFVVGCSEPICYRGTLMFVCGMWLSAVLMAQYVRTLPSGVIVKDYYPNLALKRFGLDLTVLHWPLPSCPEEPPASFQEEDVINL